jgi:hypothetical protein
VRGSLRFRAWLSLVVALLVVCSIAAAFLFPRDGKRGPFWDKYQQVELDMTKEQVEAILGPPAYEDSWGTGNLEMGWEEDGQRIEVSYGWSRKGEVVGCKSFAGNPRRRKRWWPLWGPATAAEPFELLDEQSRFSQPTNKRRGR